MLALFRKTANEAKFVERWIAAVRGSRDPLVRDAGIIVRPHPARLDEWHETDLTEFRNVAFFGDHPVDAASKNDYFDSFAHATAVVGLNTSALLEAGWRKAGGVMLPKFRRTTEGRSISTT